MARVFGRDAFDEISLSVISFLESQSSVNSIDFEERPGVLAGELDAWERTNAPCQLPADMKAFYALSNGLLLRWKYRLGDMDVPVGCMRLNALHEIVAVEFRPEGEDAPVKAGGADAQACPAFALDSGEHGLVALVFAGDTAVPQVWFEDQSGTWHLISATFTDFFRLMIVHLGLPAWQYAFTDVGLDPASKQWFRLLSPERLHINMTRREQ
eukprot:g2637.t1